MYKRRLSRNVDLHLAAQAYGDDIERNPQIVHIWYLTQVVYDNQLFITILDLFFERCSHFDLREADCLFHLLLLDDVST